MSARGQVQFDRGPVLGIVAQKHIVKGLTVGAVKGGGRR